jgi:4-carboxymuconolactone decarboxylase
MSESKFEKGEKIRRKILGDAHVDRSLANKSDFDTDFHQYITEMAWGGVWARPGLDHKTRHLITISVLAATGRDHELALHLRATKNSGVTPEEVKEALMQVAVYGGVPAANTAFSIAKEIFSERGDE